MTLPSIPPRVERGPVALRSVARFRAQYRRGTLTAITGQAGTLTRAATGTLVDSNGVTITAGHSMPRYEARLWADTAAVGLRLGAGSPGDDLTYPCDWLPERGTLYVAFSEAGTRTTSGATLAYLGNDAVTGAYLKLDADGTHYRVTVSNGSDSESVSAAVVDPTTGQACEAIVQLDDDGTDWRVRLGLAVVTQAGEEWTAWTDPITRAATWGAGAKLRANRAGSAGTLGSTWLREWGWWPGLVTRDDVRGAL